MFEDLLTSLTSGGILGGVLGTVGSIFTKRQERLLMKEKNAHELRVMEIGMRERELEFKAEYALAKQREKTVQIEADREIEVSSISAFQESIKSAAVLVGVRWIDGLRALMRPLLTSVTMGAFLVLAAYSWRYSAGLRPETVEDLVLLVVNQTVFFAGTGFTWWFGSRPSSARRI